MEKSGMTEREERFEKMLGELRRDYKDTVSKMELLKEEDKTKTATYRQLMGNRLTLLNMLLLYKQYGLLEEI